VEKKSERRAWGRRLSRKRTDIDFFQECDQKGGLDWELGEVGEGAEDLKNFKTKVERVRKSTKQEAVLYIEREQNGKVGGSDAWRGSCRK